jgi:hypothetical protein
VEQASSGRDGITEDFDDPAVAVRGSSDGRQDLALMPPAGINVPASSQHQALYHPHVEQARYFMSPHAGQGARNGR